MIALLVVAVLGALLCVVCLCLAARDADAAASWEIERRLRERQIRERREALRRRAVRAPGPYGSVPALGFEDRLWLQLRRRGEGL